MLINLRDGKVTNINRIRRVKRQDITLLPSPFVLKPPAKFDRAVAQVGPGVRPAGLSTGENLLSWWEVSMSGSEKEGPEIEVVWDIKRWECGLVWHRASGVPSPKLGVR